MNSDQKLVDEIKALCEDVPEQELPGEAVDAETLKAVGAVVNSLAALFSLKCLACDHSRLHAAK